MNFKTIISASLLCLAACSAKIETDVRLFDPSCLDNAEVLAPRIEHLRATVSAGAFQALRSDVSEEVDALGLEAATSQELDPKLEASLGHLDAAQRLGQAAVEAFEQKDYAKVRALIGEVDEEIVAFGSDYETLVRPALEDAAPGKTKAVDSIVKAASKRLSGTELFGDPKLGLVLYATDGGDRAKTVKAHAKAAEACWVARVDHTETRAQHGNADIAVKMRDDGTFNVKGLRLDASKVTQAIFKMSTQAVCVAASVSGVGACSTTTQIDTQGEDPETIALESAERKRAVLSILEDVVAAPNSAAAADPIEAGLTALPEPSSE